MIKLIIKDDDDAVAVAVAYTADNDDDDANDNAGRVVPPPAAPVPVPVPDLVGSTAPCDAMLCDAARLGWFRFACCRRLHDNAQQPDIQNRQAEGMGNELCHSLNVAHM